ncbi:hypothetical protein PV783_24525 [Chitinophaga sp. CC14]|uniref:hypothetical protein n=1 Tax=Chitinophaga sp. CC14 TaxID=3029199 RepID=UPI003B7F9BE7
MKLSNKTNALNFLENGDGRIFSTADNGELASYAWEFIRNEFDSQRPLFSNKIQYISRPFYTAYLKGRESLKEVITKEPIIQSGTLIIPTEPGATNTIFYNIYADGGKKDRELSGTMIFLNKSKEMPEPFLFGFINMKDDGIVSYAPDSMEEEGVDVMNFVSDILYLILFTKYCKMETKIIGAGKKDFHVKEKYVNETKVPIEILDSTWFTTIVRSEGFSVEGFFRMQAYGPGFSQRRLQWIPPFEKQGYTRRAKIVNQ